MKLENLSNETGLKIPDKDYFNNLPSQIQNRIQTKTKKIFLGFGLQSWSYALSFGLLIFLTWGIVGQFSTQNASDGENLSNISNSTEVLANLSDDFLDDYLLESDISTEELFAKLNEDGEQVSTYQNWENEILEDIEDENSMSDIDDFLLN